MSERWRDWLTLLSAPGVGPRIFRHLLERFDEPSRVLAAGRAELAELGLKTPTLDYIARPDPSSVEQTLVWLKRPGAHLLTLADSSYPALLAELPDPPPILFVQGDPSLLARPQLAIVGSRNPSPGGHRTAQDFARHLAGGGLVITSGLAVGIDAAAHQGSLEAGATIAVMGTGPDRIYPARHQALAQRIAASGTLVTEFPPGVGAKPENFPRRNRIISGLAVGTLVVEAARQSGSLITARLASEQGREVFAIPGSIHNPLARGCHALIRQGAKLVETAQDIVEELAPLLGSFTAFSPERKPPATDREPMELDADYTRLLAVMGHDPVAPDELIQNSGLSAEAVASMLLLLELEGLVAACPGGRYCRTGTP